MIITSQDRRVATRLGISASTYAENTARGLKWCSGCRDWHERTNLGVDRYRSDGLRGYCNTFLQRSYQLVADEYRNYGWTNREQ